MIGTTRLCLLWCDAMIVLPRREHLLLRLWKHQASHGAGSRNPLQCLLVTGTWPFLFPCIVVCAENFSIILVDFGFKKLVMILCLRFVREGYIKKRQTNEIISFHHHQVLLLLLGHRASMKSFQALRSPAIPLTSFHDLRVPLISSSIVLRHVLLGLPLLLYPWGFHSNAEFPIAPASLRNVCPIQFYFLLFIWFAIGFCWVILHSSSFVILSIYFIFIIRLKHLFTNILLFD
jgi:hypothetical protein